MYNLLSNAVKFTMEGGKITVAAALESKASLNPALAEKLDDCEQCLRVAVTDTGIGIKAEDHERIFVEFEQVDSSYARQQQGTGLGLALTRKLVEMHGGFIWVESEAGKGSKFSFLLPIQTEAAQGDTTASNIIELPSVAAP